MREEKKKMKKKGGYVTSMERKREQVMKTKVKKRWKEENKETDAGK